MYAYIYIYIYTCIYKTRGLAKMLVFCRTIAFQHICVTVIVCMCFLYYMCAFDWLRCLFSFSVFC